MAIEFRYNSEKQILFGSMSGVLTIEKYQSSAAEILSSTAFPPDIRTIWDIRNLDFSQIDRDFVNQLVQAHRSFPERSRVQLALVVSSDLGFGLTRMFEMVGEDRDGKTMVFRNFEEAEEWISRPIN